MLANTLYILLFPFFSSHCLFFIIPFCADLHSRNYSNYACFPGNFCNLFIEFSEILHYNNITRNSNILVIMRFPL